MTTKSRSFLTIVSLAVCVGFLSNRVAATITSVTVNPPPPIIVGTTVTFSANEDGQKQVVGYNWQYACNNPGCIGNFIPLPQGQQPNPLVVASRVGANTVKATNTYADQTTSSGSIGVNTLGPDHDLITAGLDVPPANTTCGITQGDLLNVQFQLMVGAQACGPSIDGSPQERIRRPQKNPPEDSGWIDGAQGKYYLQNNTIIDAKNVTIVDMDLWNQYAVGEVFDDFYQQNRMVINDCCSQQQIFYMQERHYQKIKAGANTWGLVLVAPSQP